ncbi:sulfotransferase [Sphingosinicellaceae bacterium]|nr:sulfotransferase [Sphingosinicellaceae bacterium]
MEDSQRRATHDAGIDRPVFILSSPRSGSSLLFQTLAQAPEVHTIGGESHGLIEQIPGLHPRERGWTSNRLTAADATPAITREIAQRFRASLRDRDGNAPVGRVRMIEKTPKNSLRVPFLDTVFPDAQFVFLYRDARETMSSMLEAWGSGRFRTYPLLPGWRTTPWSLLLVPGWRELGSLSLPEIVARQWASTMAILLDDLEAMATGRVVSVSYDGLLADPQATLSSLSARVGLGWDRILAESLPLSPTVVSAPRPDKWTRHEAAIAAVWPIVATVDARAREALARYAR